MKFMFTFVIIFCSVHTLFADKNVSGMNFDINVNNFNKIKKYILLNGDKETYCNMYNDNPHYTFKLFDVYLNPESQRNNINCDPSLSDFDEMVIRDWNSKKIYYSVKLTTINSIFHDPDIKIIEYYWKSILEQIDIKAEL
ncbi:hypothetical protein [Leptospira santarosai]|uniref:hypothetical protein n=1 Tax=Leptospira santarosai TaxID=28183 RepID=UPI0007783173|nr:hypothetical protein [Leptospira santarosai]KXZ24587.1 hypothetical protein AYB33_10300 [Leptospira santarosai]MDI7189384.1 hypothetical protein [Leptospira santarosai]